MSTLAQMIEQIVPIFNEIPAPDLSPKKIVARRMLAGELIPFDTGLGPLQLDANWVWVIEYETKIACVLVASAGHGLFLLWRLVANEKYDKRIRRTWVLRLLRRAFADAREMGFTCYATYIEHDQEDMAKLAGHTRCGSIGKAGAFIAGVLEDK